MVGEIRAFQQGGPGFIPGRVRNFNLYPGTGCVSCGVSGGSHDILLTIGSGRSALMYLSSVLVHSGTS